MSEVFHGACLCRGIEFDVSAPEALGTCHCTRCQRWSGSSNTVVVVSADNFKITKGEDLVRRYQEGEFSPRYFCGNCGSSLYGGSEKYYVGAGLVSDIGLKQAFHVQVANKAPWHEIGDEAPQFAEWPG